MIEGFTLSVQTIINIVLIGGLIISYLVYKIILKKHENDPSFQAKEEERIKELRRQQAENESLDEYMAQSDSDYDDEM